MLRVPRSSNPEGRWSSLEPFSVRLTSGGARDTLGRNATDNAPVNDCRDRGAFVPRGVTTFATGGQCFFVQAFKWKLVFVVQARARTCTVCLRPMTANGGISGRIVNAVRAIFRVDSRYKPKRSPIRLDVGSKQLVVQLVFSLDSYRNAGCFSPEDKSTVEGYIHFLELHSPTPSKGTLAYTKAYDATLLLAEGG